MLKFPARIECSSPVGSACCSMALWTCSGAADEQLMSQRIADQEMQLEVLTKRHDRFDSMHGVNSRIFSCG